MLSITLKPGTIEIPRATFNNKNEHGTFVPMSEIFSLGGFNFRFAWITLNSLVIITQVNLTYKLKSGHTAPSAASEVLAQHDGSSSFCMKGINTHLQRNLHPYCMLNVQKNHFDVLSAANELTFFSKAIKCQNVAIAHDSTFDKYNYI